MPQHADLISVAAFRKSSEAILTSNLGFSNLAWLSLTVGTCDGTQSRSRSKVRIWASSWMSTSSGISRGVHGCAEDRVEVAWLALPLWPLSALGGIGRLSR